MKDGSKLSEVRLPDPDMSSGESILVLIKGAGLVGVERFGDCTLLLDTDVLESEQHGGDSF